MATNNGTADAVISNVTAAATASARHQPAFLIALGFMIVAATAANIIAAVRVIRTKRDHLAFKSFPLANEFIGTADAARFPITGSCVLFGLYVLFKYLPKDLINAILSAYLCFFGVGAMSAAVKPVWGSGPLIGIAATVIGVGYYATSHWILNNVMAFSICVVAIESVPIKSFTASAILLCALFVYDVFWVFGTDVMVTVATKVDGPIKIVFPQDIFGSHEKKSLLGLGDIVIPGFFLMQMLRFSLLSTGGKSVKYFVACIVAYVASLANTMVVMVVFNAAQPALLYIVPWLLASSLLTAVVSGDLKALLAYDEETHDKQLIEAARKVCPERLAVAERENDIRSKLPMHRALFDAVLSIFGLDDESLRDSARADLKRVTAGAKAEASRRSK